MSNGAFTAEERDGKAVGAGTLLLRFITSLPLLVGLAPLAALCALVSALSGQLFLWLSGEIVRCPAVVGCEVIVPGLAYEISLSIALVIGIVALAVLVKILGWVLFEVGGQVAALALFRRLIVSLGRTRTTFFDEHPSGRIINRVVRDFDQLRTMGTIRIGDTVNALIELLVIGLVLSLAHPLAGLIILPTVVVFLYIQRNVAPMLQHLLIQRSIRFGEVLHRQTDAIEGIRTFYLYGEHRSLFRRLGVAARRFAQVHLLRAAVESWGRFWSRCAAALCTFVGLVGTALAHQSGYISTVVAAVMATALFRLSGAFEWLTWTIGYLLESAGHAKRIFEYVDLPREEDDERSIPTVASGSVSPGLGFTNYTMSYRSDTAVILKEITLDIAPGSHVGVVGRTGAGKSSLVQALFRMVRVHTGDITFAGRSLFLDSPEQSRALFAVVPQEPYLFAGTVRENIDPLAHASPAELINALSRCGFSFSLDTPVVEGGKNFSMGERQLLALARALLSKASVVIMDEPTSSVDTLTDQRMQRIIKEELRGRTIITIAHRLETLREVDRIIEIADGRIVRDGTPQEILPQLDAKSLS